MRQLKIFFLLFFLLIINNSFAVEEGIFAESTTKNEKDTDDKSVQNVDTTEKNSDLSTKKPTNKDEIKDLLLNNKLSSLMFDEEESDSIKRIMDLLKNKEVYAPNGNLQIEESKNKPTETDIDKEENEKSYIYLASIIYFNPQDWVVWLNDQKITPKTNNKNTELYLKSIQRDSVDIVWKLGVSKWKILSGAKADDPNPKVNKNNQVEVRFELKPNQTFILGSNSVVEGHAVIALLKNKQKDVVTKDDVIKALNK